MVGGVYSICRQLNSSMLKKSNVGVHSVMTKHLNDYSALLTHNRFLFEFSATPEQSDKKGSKQKHPRPQVYCF